MPARMVTLKEQLEREYGISIRALEPFGGASALVFKVVLDDGSCRVAKISLWYGFTKDPHAALEKVYDVAAKLAMEGVPLQTAYRCQSGDYVTDVEEGPLVLLRYVDGTAFSGRPEEFEAAGAALARFHVAGAAILAREPGEAEAIRVGIPVEKPYEESRPGWNILRERIMEPVPGEPPEIAVARDAVPQLEVLMRSIDAAFGHPLTVSILHNDFSGINGMYGENGGFAGFIDVDQLGVGPCIHDIANTLSSLSTEYCKTHTIEEFHQMALLFMRAYHGVHPLPADEYRFLLAANQRWDVTRILRILRRHFEGGGSFENPLGKMATRFIPRLSQAPATFAFMTADFVSSLGPAERSSV